MATKLVGDQRRRALLEYYGLMRQIERNIHEMTHLKDKFRRRPLNIDEAILQGQAKKRFVAIQSDCNAASAHARRLAESIGVKTAAF